MTPSGTVTALAVLTGAIDAVDSGERMTFEVRWGDVDCDGGCGVGSLVIDRSMFADDGAFQLLRDQIAAVLVHVSREESRKAAKLIKSDAEVAKVA